MVIHFLDTSAILNGGLHKFLNVYVSPLVITELENIKQSNKSEAIKYQAREAVREIIASDNIQYNFISQKQLKKIIDKYDFLIESNDHYILAEAEQLGRMGENSIHFITSDGAQYLFAQQLPHIIAEFLGTTIEEKQDLWGGWSKYYPNEEQLNMLYNDKKMNILKCQTNEFAEIYVGSELKDVLFWDGKEYRPLKYKEIRSEFLNKSIRPLNLEQKMAFDLLQNPDIPVKLFTGVPGSGKDYLMFLHAWDLVKRGKKDKIIFIRNLVPFKDAPEIGFLEGSLQKKIEWGLGPIASILGDDGLQMAEQTGQIEAVNLGFIRGMSWDDTILYVSEGQNITGGGYKLLVSRCGKNSELWINGDTLQTDDKKFETNNGIERLLKNLAGNKLFGTVKLLKTERSDVAELASCI